MSDLSTENWQARNGWQDIFRALNEKNMQPKILYPVWLTFKMDGEIKSFQDWQDLRACNNQTSTIRNTKWGSIKEERTQECHRTEIYRDNL